MLGSLAPDRHGIDRLHAGVHGLDEALMLPALDPALLSRACTDFSLGRSDRWSTNKRSMVRPASIAVVAVCEILPGRAAIGVLFRQIDERFLAETALSFGAGGIGPRREGGHANISASEQVGAAIVAGISNGLDLIETERFLGFRGHLGQLSAIDDLVCDLMGDDEVVFGFNSRLNIVANDAGQAIAGHHQPRIRIGERNLLVG